MQWPIQASTIFGGIPVRLVAGVREEFAILAFHGENLQSTRRPTGRENPGGNGRVVSPRLEGCCERNCGTSYLSLSTALRLEPNRPRRRDFSLSCVLRGYFFGSSFDSAFGADSFVAGSLAAGLAAAVGFGGGVRPSIVSVPTLPVFTSTVRIAWLFVSAT